LECDLQTHNFSISYYDLEVGEMKTLALG
jgi:hypothetical protein